MLSELAPPLTVLHLLLQQMDPLLSQGIRCALILEFQKRYLLLTKGHMEDKTCIEGLLLNGRVVQKTL